MILSWSSGKDAAYTLLELQAKNIQVEGLFTTISAEFQRVSMHGLRLELLKSQAKALDLPLYTLQLPENCSMEEYSKLMKEKMGFFSDLGIKEFAFGDIFLEDLKEYRIKKCKEAGFEAVFPIFGNSTQKLAHNIIDSGIEALTVCVNLSKLTEQHCGQAFTTEFIRSLPKSVDPCGENGEFHTFVWNAPNFNQTVPFILGEYEIHGYPDPESEGVELQFGFQDVIPT